MFYIERSDRDVHTDLNMQNKKRIYIKRVLEELPKCFLCRHIVIDRGN